MKCPQETKVMPLDCTEATGGSVFQEPLGIFLVFISKFPRKPSCPLGFSEAKAALSTE